MGSGLENDNKKGNDHLVRRDRRRCNAFSYQSVHSNQMVLSCPHPPISVSAPSVYLIHLSSVSQTTRQSEFREDDWRWETMNIVTRIYQRRWIVRQSEYPQGECPPLPVLPRSQASSALNRTHAGMAEAAVDHLRSVGSRVPARRSTAVWVTGLVPRIAGLHRPFWQHVACLAP